MRKHYTASCSERWWFPHTHTGIRKCTALACIYSSTFRVRSAMPNGRAGGFFRSPHIHWTTNNTQSDKSRCCAVPLCRVVSTIGVRVFARFDSSRVVVSCVCVNGRILWSECTPFAWHTIKSTSLFYRSPFLMRTPRIILNTTHTSYA